MKSKLMYYQWGNEPAGYVSTWILGKDGEVVSKGMKKKKSLPKTAKESCPYS